MKVWNAHIFSIQNIFHLNLFGKVDTHPFSDKTAPIE